MAVWSQTSSYPQRTGNVINVYIDGQDSFAAIYDATQAAKSYIYATFAYVDFDFHLMPDIVPQSLLSEMMARAKAGVDVRLLIWSPASGTPGTIQNPVQEYPGTNAGPGTVQIRWDVAPGKGIYPAKVGCHHQKSFVMDGIVAFVGGINSYQPYWDTNAHAPVDNRRYPYSIPRPLSDWNEQGYPPLHDLFSRIQGPCIQDAEANFCERWNGATFKHAPGAQDIAPHIGIVPPGGNLTLQITRTIAPNAYTTTPAGEMSIRESYLSAINVAQKLIYFEDQYYYDNAVCDALMQAAQRGVKIIGLLCLKPDEGTGVGLLDQALESINMTRIDFAGKLDHENIGLFSPVVAAPDTPADGQYQYTDVYVHAKMLIVDDLFITLGSANISFTSMEFHSELNVIANDASVAETLRQCLWQEHFQRQLADAELNDPATALALWRDQAARNKAARTAFQAPVSRIYPFS
jgi:phosphatidylserine/phosphatidylglycerophosphate/cardiolipin synthase-like enzyme